LKHAAARLVTPGSTVSLVPTAIVARHSTVAYLLDAYLARVIITRISAIRTVESATVSITPMVTIARSAKKDITAMH